MSFFFLLMIRRPPRSTRTDTLCPYTSLITSICWNEPLKCSSGRSPMSDLPTKPPLVYSFPLRSRAQSLERQFHSVRGRQSHMLCGIDRKSTRLNSVTNAHLVCRLLLEKKKNKDKNKINHINAK